MELEQDLEGLLEESEIYTKSGLYEKAQQKMFQVVGHIEEGISYLACRIEELAKEKSLSQENPIIYDELERAILSCGSALEYFAELRHKAVSLMGDSIVSEADSWEKEGEIERAILLYGVAVQHGEENELPELIVISDRNIKRLKEYTPEEIALSKYNSGMVHLVRAELMSEGNYFFYDAVRKELEIGGERFLGSLMSGRLPQTEHSGANEYCLEILGKLISLEKMKEAYRQKLD